ncbi:nucleoside phosphorylase domain-containing protein [Aspergillus crustosus]
MRPTDCDDFSTAIVCALPLEVDAVLASFDEYYDEHSEKFTKKQGDLNVYYTGRIGAHNVVLCCLPAMGKVGAASVVSSLRISFTQINLVLVVGICGGSPSPEKKDEIYLGDVVIANELMEYDYGRQYPDGFQEKKTPLQLNRETQNILTSFDVKQTRNQLEKKLCEYLQKVQKTSSAAQHPTGRHDIVYRGTEIIRMRKQVKSPKVHIGPIASADTVMKSREHRDKVAREHGVIGFEMEGAGAWDGMGTYGCLIIKGVCDYADHHKDKLWQDYAAATGAAAAKAFLSYWPHLRKPSKGPTMIPVPIDPAFTGRESELQHLEDTIASGVRALALAGLGGIGKTQLAAQFARRRTKNNHSKSAVFWIQCTSIEAIQKGYADILRELKMDDTEPAEAESMVKAHLRDRDTAWLLVLDNVDELVIWEAIRNIVPNSDHGHVLATTRTLTVADRIASHHHILVEEPSHQDATEMLRRRLRNKSLLEDTDTIAALLNELAYLPLAITQAASYVNQFTNITLAKYLSDLRKQEADTVKLLSKDFGDPGNYGNVPNAVIKTWLVSFNQISKVPSRSSLYTLLLAI